MNRWDRRSSVLLAFTRCCRLGLTLVDQPVHRPVLANLVVFASINKAAVLLSGDWSAFFFFDDVASFFVYLLLA